MKRITIAALAFAGVVLLNSCSTTTAATAPTEETPAVNPASTKD